VGYLLDANDALLQLMKGLSITIAAGQLLFVKPRRGLPAMFNAHQLMACCGIMRLLGCSDMQKD
jgi:hypothetical protein